jgi:hypothetical protein
LASTSVAVNSSDIQATCPSNTLDFFGTAPSVTNSNGSLFLNEDVVNERVFQWKSSDPILADVDTGCVTASRWNYFPGSPARLVFTGSADGATLKGDVLFEPYNRAVVNVVKGSKRVRYLLTNKTILVTGFKPFNKSKANVSEDVVKTLEKILAG